MDALNAIFTRRSVRQYTGDGITETQLKTLLEAGMCAPSAGNQQAWEFIVVDDDRVMKAIPSVHPYSKMLTEAAVAIIVCGNLQRERHEGYWVQDCSAATQNILLTARAMDLGAVWLGVYPRKDRVKGVQKLLELPAHIVPLCIISVGHPAIEQKRVERYDQNRVHRNRW